MFGNRYFGARYFGDAYFGQGGDAVPVVVAVTPSQGGIGAKEYESRVRAWWNRIEAEQQAQTERRERVAELERQRAALEAKRAESRKKESERSARAKRRAKLVAEIEQVQREIVAAETMIAELMALVTAQLAEEQRLAVLSDRRRRMVLLLAAA